jgi:hypothetical protein
MRDLVKETIKGEAYQFGYLSSSLAIKTATEVAQRLLPPLGKIIPRSGSIQDLMKRDLSKLDVGAGFESLAQALDSEAVLAMIKTLCSVVIGPEGAIDFEEHFKGRPGLAVLVAKKSFEVNCSDFFASAAGLVGFLKTATTTPAKAK